MWTKKRVTEHPSSSECFGIYSDMPAINSLKCRFQAGRFPVRKPAVKQHSRLSISLLQSATRSAQATWNLCFLSTYCKPYSLISEAEKQVRTLLLNKYVIRSSGFRYDELIRLSSTSLNRYLNNGRDVFAAFYEASLPSTCMYA